MQNVNKVSLKNQAQAQKKADKAWNYPFMLMQPFEEKEIAQTGQDSHIGHTAHQNSN